MLAGTSRKPDEIVGHMHPTEFRADWEYTVEKVAVNAVMAGAKPEYFPVILALAASGVPRGEYVRFSSAIVVVNGPIRKEMGMNLGMTRWALTRSANADDRPRLRPALAEPARRLGAGRHFHGLTRQQLHLQQPHLRRERGTNPWEPMHVQKGFKPTDSVVSIFYGCRSTTFCLGLREKHWQGACA